MRKGLTKVTQRTYLIAQLLTTAKRDKPGCTFTLAANTVDGMKDLDEEVEKTWTEWDQHYGVNRRTQV